MEEDNGIIYVYCKHFHYKSTPHAEEIKNNLKGHPMKNRVYKASKTALTNKEGDISDGHYIHIDDKEISGDYFGIVISGLGEVNSTWSCEFEEFSVDRMFDLNFPDSEVDKVLEWEKQGLRELSAEEVFNSINKEKEEQREEELKELASLLPIVSDEDKVLDYNASEYFQEIVHHMKLPFLESSVIECIMNYGDEDQKDPQLLERALTDLTILIKYNHGAPALAAMLQELGL